MKTLMKKNQQTKQIGLLMPADLYRKLSDKAEKEMTSVSALIRQIVNKAIN